MFLFFPTLRVKQSRRLHWSLLLMYAQARLLCEFDFWDWTKKEKSLLESHKIMFLFVRSDWKGLSDFYTYFSFYLAYENALSSKENRAFKRRTMDALNALEKMRWKWRFDDEREIVSILVSRESISQQIVSALWELTKVFSEIEIILKRWKAYREVVSSLLKKSFQMSAKFCVKQGALVVNCNYSNKNETTRLVSMLLDEIAKNSGKCLAFHEP